MAKINVKQKGNTYERNIVKFYRDELGFSKAKTSRATSKLLDDCKVDINFIPHLVQTKNGYANNRPKFDVLKKECMNLIEENYPDDEKKLLLDKPYVLFHKLGVEEMITIDRAFFKSLMLSKIFFDDYSKAHKIEIDEFFNKLL